MDLLSDLSGIFDFLFFWEGGEKRREWEEVNVKEGFEGVCKLPVSYKQIKCGGKINPMGNKNGTLRFYGRVCKNIFYEEEDKERERGFLGMGGNLGIRAC